MFVVNVLVKYPLLTSPEPPPPPDTVTVICDVFPVAATPDPTKFINDTLLPTSVPSSDTEICISSPPIDDPAGNASVPPVAVIVALPILILGTLIPSEVSSIVVLPTLIAGIAIPPVAVADMFAVPNLIVDPCRNKSLNLLVLDPKSNVLLELGIICCVDRVVVKLLPDPPPA